MSPHTKEIATTAETLYNPVHRRSFRLLVRLAGACLAGRKDLLSEGAGMEEGDMAAHDNANAAEFLGIPDHLLVRRMGMTAYRSSRLPRRIRLNRCPNRPD